MTLAGRQNRYERHTAVFSAIDEIPREGFVAVFPSEPPEATRRLFARCEVAVIVTPRVGPFLRVLTPAEFLRWAERLR